MADLIAKGVTSAAVRKAELRNRTSAGYNEGRQSLSIVSGFRTPST